MKALSHSGWAGCAGFSVVTRVLIDCSVVRRDEFFCRTGVWAFALFIEALLEKQVGGDNMTMSSDIKMNWVNAIQECEVRFLFR